MQYALTVAVLGKKKLSSNDFEVICDNTTTLDYILVGFSVYNEEAKKK